MKHSKVLSSRLKPKTITTELPNQKIIFEAIGTIWHINFISTVSTQKLNKLRACIVDRIEIYDRNYSRFREDSWVSSISKNKGLYKMPDDAEPLLDLYESLYKHTNGLMTPMIGQMISDAGYDINYSFQSSELFPSPIWNEALNYYYPNLTVLKPVLLDFGAAGKGYLIDIISKLIAAAGIDNYTIYGGGDILVRSLNNDAVEIGLEHPDKIGQMIGLAEVINRSICGSATNRRSWGEYHHIFNPKTMLPTNHILATWVIADSTLLADGLSTALFFTDAAKLTKYYDFEYVVINSDYSLEHSAHFPASFFTTNESKALN
jgi:thiamine biosynthesis lipoprotein